MFHAEFVRDPAQVFQGAGPLTEHPSRSPADRINEEVGVDVLRVQMGGDEYLAVRPSLRRKLLRHLMRQRSCDLFLR